MENASKFDDFYKNFKLKIEMMNENSSSRIVGKDKNEMIADL